MSERYRRTYYVQPDDVLDKAEAEARAKVEGKLSRDFIDGWIEAARTAGDTLLMHSLARTVQRTEAEERVGAAIAEDALRTPEERQVSLDAAITRYYDDAQKRGVKTGD